MTASCDSVELSDGGQVWTPVVGSCGVGAGGCVQASSSSSGASSQRLSIAALPQRGTLPHSSGSGSGTDASTGCEAGFAFKLNGSDIKECGRGQVRAYIGGVNFVARTNQVAASDAPWQIPNPGVVGDIAPYLTAGRKRLVFKLFYNDQPGTPVEPQRSAELYVNLQ